MEEILGDNEDTRKIMMRQDRANKKSIDKNNPIKDFKSLNSRKKKKLNTQSHQDGPREMIAIEEENADDNEVRGKKGKANCQFENLNGKILKITEIKSRYKCWRLFGQVVAKGPIIINNSQKYKTFCFEVEDSDNELIEIQCKDQVCDQFFDFVQLNKFYIFSDLFAPNDGYQRSRNMKVAYLQKWSDVKEKQKTQIIPSDVQTQMEEFMRTMKTIDLSINRIRSLELNQFQSVQLTSLFFPDQQHERKYFTYLENVEKTLKICMYSLTSTQIIDYLQWMSTEVTIQIIVDSKQSKKVEQKQCLLSLSQQNNIEIRLTEFPSQHGSMHNKYVIIDSKTLMTGSLNWSDTAFKINNENVMVIEDPKTSQEYTDKFNQIWITAITFKTSEDLVEKQIENSNPQAQSPIITESDIDFVTRFINEFTAQQEQVQLSNIDYPIPQEETQPIKLPTQKKLIMIKPKPTNQKPSQKIIISSSTTNTQQPDIVLIQSQQQDLNRNVIEEKVLVDPTVTQLDSIEVLDSFEVILPICSVEPIDVNLEQEFYFLNLDVPMEKYKKGIYDSSLLSKNNLIIEHPEHIYQSQSKNSQQKDRQSIKNIMNDQNIPANQQQTTNDPNQKGLIIIKPKQCSQKSTQSQQLIKKVRTFQPSPDNYECNTHNSRFEPILID